MKQLTLLLPVAIGMLLSLCTPLAGAEAVSPAYLRCEYLVNPLGIDVNAPRLSWEVRSEKHGARQTAYRILVASSAEKLEKNHGDLWDSKKVSSDDTIQVAYKGKPMKSRMRCFWKVKIWDQNGQASGWSPIADWSMGLLDPADWQAAWIGFDEVPETEATPAAKTAGKNQIVIIKALYGIPGEPAKQVDLTEKLQKQIDSGQLKVSGTNKLAGKDPAFGEKKQFELEYTISGKTKKITVSENVTLDLSTGKNAKKKRTEKVYLPAPHLRKEFEVKAPIERAVVYVTAQGVFELHLNGERIGDEYFMPGWTDYRTRIYYRTYDVTSMLQSGANAIGAILGDGWFRGNISNIGQNKYGKTLRLKAQLHLDYADGKTEIISSDPTWKASFGPILESDMQAGETYDARLELPDWDRPGFNDSEWSATVTGSEIEPLIQAYPGVPVRKTQELPTVELTEPKPQNYVFDLGQNFSGWIRLKVNGKAGEKVVMRFAEMLKGDGTVYTENLRSARATDTYILKGDGEEVWEPHFTFHGFRYVEVTGLSVKPTADMVTGIVVHSDAPMTSSFECSNPLLNQLHSNIVWGQRSNYLEVPTDCPQRDERLAWTGDTQVFIRSGTYNQDVAAFFTNWMVDLMDTQNKAGTFGQQAPVFHGHGSPAWADAGVICPWTIYKVYGDVRMIEKYYGAMAKFIDFCKSHGLEGRGGGFGDWLAVGSKTPKDLISAAYFAYTTSLMIEIAEALDKKEDAAEYRELFEAIRANFQKSFVEADGKIAGNSQTAYCLAIYYDLLTEKQREQAAAHLVERIVAKDYHLSVGFVGVGILLPTLTEIGRSDLAYRLIQNTSYPSWGYSIEQGATTIWERWNSYTKDKGFGNAKMNSFNHYAYGACSEWMFRSMLGIGTEGAGFKKIEMKPELGHGVTWTKGHYDSIHGRIESDWKLDGATFRWKIVIPPNTTATVYVPAKQIKDVTENGKSISKAPGVTFMSTEKDRVVLSVKPGTFQFASQLKQ